MGRYRTDLTFQRTAPDEVRIYRDGDYVGDIFKDEDILNSGTHHYLIWLSDEWRGWKRFTDRSKLRDTVRPWVDSHPFYA